MMGSLRRSLLVLSIVGLSLFGLTTSSIATVSAQTVTWVPTPAPPPSPAQSEPAPAESAPAPAESAPAHAEPPTVAPAPEAASVETDALEIAPEPEVRPRAEGRALAAPAFDPVRVERALRNLAFAEQALTEERGGADLTLAVAVNLYVGGGLLSIASVSLLVGVVLESVCINGVVDECLDGPSFLAGFIPSALGAAALLVGARTTEERASAHYRSLEERANTLEARRLAGPSAALEPTVGISLGAGSLRMDGTF